MTEKQITSLRWYATHGVNNGRGRLTAESKALLRLGYLNYTATSYYCWALTLSRAGRAALAQMEAVHAS